MFERIETIPSKALLGKSTRMSLANNTTFELWQGFMKAKGAIKNAISTDLYSIQIYDSLLSFQNFNSNTEFTKWACIEVTDVLHTLNDFEVFNLKSGLYAVFTHKGTPADFPKTMQYILSEWLPKSGYQLDNRPHFEVLDTRYKQNDPSSEESVYIPIKIG